MHSKTCFRVLGKIKDESKAPEAQTSENGPKAKIAENLAKYQEVQNF